MADTMRTYRVDVWVDGKIYRRFAAFDAIGRTRKWIRPALFALIFCAFATVCFLLENQSNQATLLGTVLLVVGLGFPAVYFGTYYTNLQKKIEKLKIDKNKRRAYCITLSEQPDGIEVDTRAKNPLRYEWKNVYAAYRFKDVIYLYAEAGRAYILPGEQIEAGIDAVWSLMTSMLPPEKLHLR